MKCNKTNFWIGVAGLNGFMAVAMGAVAAHAIADAAAASMANKASLYQLIHAVVLVAMASRSDKALCVASWVFLLGISLFCGSLYLRALMGWDAVTTVAPAGGVSLMIGWLLLSVAALRNDAP